jgi:hypothetical protein
MLVRDEFLTQLRYYKRKIEADPSASLERRYAGNEFASNVERHRRQLLVHSYRMLGCLPDAEERCRKLCFVPGGIATASRKARRCAPPLPRGYDRLPRKYVCGVVPSMVRNISMKALTLS